MPVAATEATTEATTEAARLDILRMLDVLDTPAEPAFDALVRSASMVCGCPISLMSLIDVDRQWFKAQVGIDARETPRDQAFCAHAIRGDGLFEIADATRDPRFVDNPLVTGDLGIRFYAGQPIVYDGVALGTLCVIDRVPRTLDGAQREHLRDLALVLAQLLHGRLEATLHRRQADRLRDFAQLSGDWLWESDRTSRRTWMSGDPARLAGLFHDGTSGDRFVDLEVLDWLGRPGTGPGLAGLFARGDAFSNVVVAIGAADSRRFISLSGIPIADQHGAAAGFRGSAQDVTTRVAAEIRGRAQEAALRKITAQAPGIIYQFHTSPAGVMSFPFASEGIRELFEITPDDVQRDATALFGRILPEDLVDLRASVQTSRSDGTPWHSRFRVQLPKKGLRWLQGSSVPEQLDDGGTLWTGYMMDVTESHARDRDLAASERRIRAVTDNMPAMISHVGRDERYTFANAAIGRLFGIDPASLIGKSMREVCEEQVYDDIKPWIDNALAGRRAVFEGTSTVNGRLYHYQSVYMPDVGPDGDVAGFYAMTFDTTQRRNAELAQARSEKLLRGITDHLPALVCYVDLEDRYRFANGTYGTWLGLDPAAMIGRQASDVLDAESWSTMRPYVLRARAGERQRFERCVRIDGRERHLLSEFVPDVDDAGRVIGLYAMATDVTERRQAELELINSERRLLDLTNNMPAVIGQFDMDERCVFANGVSRRIYGLAPEELSRLTFRSHISDDLYAMHEPAIRTVLAGQRSEVEGHRLYKDRMTWFKAHFIPQFDSDGVQRGFYVMSFDVSSLKRAQMEREHSEAHLRQITDALPVLISYVDADERMNYINETFKRWIGIAAEQIVGRTVLEAIGPVLYEQRKDYIHRCLAGETVRFEMMSPSQGGMRNLQTTYLPDVKADGRVIGITTMSVDVTEMKAAEQRLSELAHIDTLTGLPNRRSFDHRLDETLAERALGGLTAVMFLDIDHFKTINDTHGHGVGDGVLVEFAQRVQGSVRSTDFVARLAGDEFVVILRDLSASSEVETIARKIVRRVGSPFVIDRHRLQVTTSVGIALRDDGVESAAHLLARADDALYRAKNAGRNTFRTAPTDIARRAILAQ